MSKKKNISAIGKDLNGVIMFLFQSFYKTLEWQTPVSHLCCS